MSRTGSRPSHPTTPTRLVTLATALLAVMAAVGGCGGGAGQDTPDSDSSPSSSNTANGTASKTLCTPGNDYLWYLAYFGGQNGGPPQGATEGEPLLAEMVKLSSELAKQAPTEQKSAARGANLTWTETQRIFAKYKYAGDNMPPSATNELTSRVGKYQQSNQAFAQYLFETCDGQSGSFPTQPADPVVS